MVVRNSLLIKVLFSADQGPVPESLAAVSVLSSTGVSYGLANSFSALLPRFSSHRLRFFFSDEKDALRVIFSISDPAMVGLN